MAKLRKDGKPDMRVNNGGQNRWSPDEPMIRTIERLASIGLTITQIAAFCDVDESTISLHRDEIASWVAKGKAKGIAQIAGNLFTKACGNKELGIQPDVTAQIFYLKTQGRWREADADPFMEGLKSAMLARISADRMADLLEETREEQTRTIEATRSDISRSGS